MLLQHVGILIVESLHYFPRFCIESSLEGARDSSLFRFDGLAACSSERSPPLVYIFLITSAFMPSGTSEKGLVGSRLSRSRCFRLRVC